jgi:VanZ family protein
MKPTRALWKFLSRWGPALGLMALIFSLSSLPAQQVPEFGILDLLVKKVAHFVGYALLARAFMRGMKAETKKQVFLAWLLAVLYGVTDEIHQSFVPGRRAALLDVGIDGLGAFFGVLPALLRLHPWRRLLPKF